MSADLRLSGVFCLRKWCGLVLQVVFNRGDDADGFDVGRGRVAVFDGELALLRSFNFTQAAFGVFGELVGSGAGVLCGFLDHLGFDVVEFGVLELHLIAAVLLGGEGNAALHKFGLALHQTANGGDVGGGDGDDARSSVAIARVFAVSVGFAVGNGSWLDANLLFLNAVLREESEDFSILALDGFVDGGGIVAHFFVNKRPNDEVGVDLLF